MVLFIIGLGLADEKDITLKGLEMIKKSDAVYLECYTSILFESTLDKMKELYGKPIIILDRESVEGEATMEKLLLSAKTQNVSLLVVGDPFCATTHSDLYLRAVKLFIPVQVVHNASIISAVGASGMQVYRFGETVSIPFFTAKWRPYSFYDKIKANRKMNLHTLVLLDIKVKEPTEESLAKGKPVYMPPRYMLVETAAEQLLEAEGAKGEKAYSGETKCMAIARVGAETQQIVAGTLEEMRKVDVGGPLHSMVICAGELHPIEEEMFNFYRKKCNSFSLYFRYHLS
eukprot:TRINITY_DN5985_c0_g3_i5.p1 TRINITY_DN5985_c0_g3~~TRINITY_DN5985_c0_g3_i5.p1  ORF type:complete len:305 (+),score=71.35 TRINITY_DN5985_c0_g3_i5:56-916(+)